MSSPDSAKAGKVGTVAAKAPVAKVSRGFDKVASDAGMSRSDKVNFIKAMLEGVKPRDTAQAASGKQAGGAVKSASEANAAKRAKPAAGKPKKVVLLRKIPAPVRIVAPSNPASDEARKLAAMVEAKLVAGDLGVLTPEAIQALMQALCKLYSANIDAGNKFPVVDHRMAITGTDAMILCGALLKAVDLQVFELGMWQSWSGV